MSERQAAGATAHATMRPDDLDAIFRANGQRTPDALALADPLDRASFASGSPRRLSYREADAAVGRLANRLVELGLPSESRIALCLPNTVEAVIALLAAHRAGLVAALVPFAWSREHMLSALDTIAPKALLVSDARTGSGRLCDTGMDVAADLFSVRFVCGFGADLPDGVVRLDDVFEDSSASELSNAGMTSSGVITFEFLDDTPRPAMRSAGQLLAGGLAVFLEAEIPRVTTILSTVLVPSFAGLASGVVPWLLSGGALVLHQPINPASLAEQMREFACDTLIVPGPLASDVVDRFGSDRPRRVLGVWRAAEAQRHAPPWTHAQRLTDVLAFGEAGLIALRRHPDGSRSAIPSGAVRPQEGASPGPAVITTSRTERGTLVLSGPMLPAEARVEDTGYPCDFDPATETFAITGPRLAANDPPVSPAVEALQAPAA